MSNPLYCLRKETRPHRPFLLAAGEFTFSAGKESINQGNKPAPMGEASYDPIPGPKARSVKSRRPGF